MKKLMVIIKNLMKRSLRPHEIQFTYMGYNARWDKMWGIKDGNKTLHCTCYDKDEKRVVCEIVVTSFVPLLEGETCEFSGATKIKEPNDNTKHIK